MLKNLWRKSWFFYPVKLKMLDLIKKHLGYGQLWPACSPNQTRSYYMPDPASFIWFGSVVDPIWMACSGLGHRHLVQKQTEVQESSGPVLAECNWPTTCFPLSVVSDSVEFCCRWPESYCGKPAWIQFGFWLTVSECDLTDPVWKQTSDKKSSSLLLANASEPILIRNPDCTAK